jgi:hypothetical protein
MQHILLQCVFAREVWFHTLSLIGLQCLTPGTAESSFQDWWHRSGTKIQKAQKKGFNSVVILVAWWLWKHRNSCVFDGATPDISKITQDIRDDAKMWCLAGLAACRAERFVALTHGEFRPGRLLYSHLCNIPLSNFVTIFIWWSLSKSILNIFFFNIIMRSSPARSREKKKCTAGVYPSILLSLSNPYICHTSCLKFQIIQQNPVNSVLCYSLVPHVCILNVITALWPNKLVLLCDQVDDLRNKNNYTGRCKKQL